ncbi:hypothetical protein BESB_078390 [Besnoitia besnoiti]|uniref:Uncharacterized protein n=1 Tax=Besnoitia besnoiti TaxID=94643 RepID=A0A2A9MD65_BESBE|nr:hypothetical protein BESB_078390 [Besnoitia besnoiti]PFH33623.1 hypothetical protein BESB_078390 [Besnoitia besnoiti]
MDSRDEKQQKPLPSAEEEPQKTDKSEEEEKGTPPASMKSQVSFAKSAKSSDEDMTGKLTGVKSMVSFGESAAGSGDYTHLDTKDFLKSRQGTSKMFGLPSQFFQSRASIRTWAAEEIADPMVQPYEKNDPNLPRPFHTSLPGYEPRLCKYVLTKGEKPPRDPLLGPEVSVFPPTWIPHWEPDPNFKPQAYNFNWEDNGTFQMDKLPYPKAVFEPADGSAHKMYNQAYPYTAYPYGVPRV